MVRMNSPGKVSSGEVSGELCIVHYMLENVSYYFVMHIGHKYDNFIVGLTNSNPNISIPTLWNYEVCGQYPGAVPNGATVSVYCRDCLPPFRYVIVQLPLNDHFVACEIEVLVRGTRMSNINISVQCCFSCM